MADSELRHLMGAYYHEDFDDFGGLWGTLERYLADDPPQDQRQLLLEIGVVLSDTARSDIELGNFLEKMGSNVYFDETPGGYRGWLEEIARRVRLHLGD